jgi:CubicO group peptidase (beta-lactamase class C family)
LDPAILCPAGPRFDAWRAADLHAILVVRNGKLVFEHYMAGADELYGQIISNVSFDADKQHDVRSVTKSITSLVLGIAVGRRPAHATPGHGEDRSTDAGSRPLGRTTGGAR